jgi:hypothetical protein
MKVQGSQNTIRYEEAGSSGQWREFQDDPKLDARLRLLTASRTSALSVDARPARV